jgi:hypothetical protein
MYESYTAMRSHGLRQEECVLCMRGYVWRLFYGSESMVG